ncbi:thiopeptide-type bacteriocin biosynthesis protein [Streptomyces phaeochromogenes]|uniref:thiopeptide-type bacteriocin biosynthesis protein n=1 Tax=Streptomyces phaeochromogenes TaxID=1923 RepID=UPI00386629BE
MSDRSGPSSLRSWPRSARLAPPRQPPQHTITERLGPALFAAEEAGQVPGWWFMNKQPWPLRYQAPEPSLLVERLLNNLADDGTIRSWVRGIYEPETAAFGGRYAMDAAHELFHAEPWEDAVTCCLTVLCRQAAGQPFQRHLQGLVATYLVRTDEQGMTVFNPRLGLTVVDAVASPDHPAARLVVAELHRRATEMTDGYAARETLGHPSVTALMTDREAQGCRTLLRTCALGAGIFPTDLHDEVEAALRVSGRIIRNSVAAPIGRQTERGR